MKKLSLIVLLVFLTHFNLFSQNRPKVLVDQAQIEEIKLKINITGTYSYEIWQILKSKIPVWIAGFSPSKDHLDYGEVSNMAFASKLIDDPILQNQWADSAINCAVNDFSTNFYEPGNMPIGGLFNANSLSINTSIVYDLLYERLNSSQKSNLESKILTAMDFLRTYQNINDYGNFYNTRQSHVNPGLIIGGITIFGEVPDTDYSEVQFSSDISTAKYILFENNKSYFDYFFGSQGSYQDGFSYFGINFGRMWLGLQALSKFESTNYFNFPKIKNKLEKVSKWLSFELFPNNEPKTHNFNCLNDEGGNKISAVHSSLLSLAQIYQDGIARWLFDQTFGNITDFYIESNHGHPEVYIMPLIIYTDIPSESPTIEKFGGIFIDENRGLLYWRSGWNDQDLQFSIESTPAFYDNIVYVKHNQSDKGNITLTAYGNNFIYDPDGDETSYNNYICIDGKGESFSSWWLTNGSLSDYEQFNNFEKIRALTKDAYCTLYKDTTIGLLYTIKTIYLLKVI